MSIYIRLLILNYGEEVILITFLKDNEECAVTFHMRQTITMIKVRFC